MGSGQQRGAFGRWVDRVVATVSSWAGVQPAVPDVPAGPELIRGVGWHQFELLVAEGFRHRGYRISETGGGGGRAVDMVLTRGTEEFLVDCKPWRVQAVGIAPVRELAALIRSRSAAGGFVLSSGSFTAEAREYAEARRIQLIDGDALRELLHSREEKTQPVVVRRAGPFLDTTLPPQAWRLRAQPCPRCGGPMVEVERNGARQLRCTHHPLCEGTRDLG